MATALEDDAQKRNAKADGNANGADSGNGCDKRAPGGPDGRLVRRLHCIHESKNLSDESPIFHAVLDNGVAGFKGRIRGQGRFCLAYDHPGDLGNIEPRSLPEWEPGQFFELLRWPGCLGQGIGHGIAKSQEKPGVEIGAIPQVAWWPWQNSAALKDPGGCCAGRKRPNRGAHIDGYRSAGGREKPGLFVGFADRRKCKCAAALDAGSTAHAGQQFCLVTLGEFGNGGYAAVRGSVRPPGNTNFPGMNT